MTSKSKSVCDAPSAMSTCYFVFPDTGNVRIENRGPHFGASLVYKSLKMFLLVGKIIEGKFMKMNDYITF